MQLDTEELAIIYSTLEECLNSDGWDNLADEIGGIVDKVKLQLKQPRQ